MGGSGQAVWLASPFWRGVVALAARPQALRFCVVCSICGAKVRSGFDLHLAAAVRSVGAAARLSRRARDACRCGWPTWALVAASVLEEARAKAVTGHDSGAEKGSRTLDPPRVPG